MRLTLSAFRPRLFRADAIIFLAFVWKIMFSLFQLRTPDYQFYLLDKSLNNSRQLSTKLSTTKREVNTDSPTWKKIWQSYASSRNCFLTGYKTMEDEFIFYKKLLLSRPKILSELEDTLETSPILTSRYILKVEIKDGKLHRAQCLGSKCGVYIHKIVTKWGLDELIEVFKYFKNLTFYYAHEDPASSCLCPEMPFGISQTLTEIKKRCLPEVAKTLSRETIERISMHAAHPKPLPIFTAGKLVGCDGDILAPGLVDDVGRKPCKILVPWAKRQPTVFWRGSDTGGGIYGYRGKVLESIKRSRIPSDLGFTTLFSTGCQPVLNCPNLAAKTKLLVTHGLSMCMHQKFKYLLDIDGNAFSRRFPTLASTGSCIIRFGAYSAWYHDFLKPGIHYVHMPDVAISNESMFEKLFPSDSQAETIAKRMVLDAQRVMDNGAKCYWLRLLFNYAETFGFQMKNL